jgi:multiple sugar transport system substrate-binding protein
MPFQPAVNQELVIDGVTYRVAEHPAAVGIPYGQEGRAAIVYQLVSPWPSQGEGQGEGLRALKVFKPRYRSPGLVMLAGRLVSFASLPGLQVCRRSVLAPQHHVELLRQYPDLTYAVLMPWVEGPTWMEVLLEKRAFTPAESLAVARSLVEILVAAEQRNLAHCDLSASNVMLPLLAGGAGVALVDVEGMYGPVLERPREVMSGSPGYAHRTASEGIWSAEADRFAGAVLVAEMLGWCDRRVREAAWGEDYFEPQEMQRDGDRYRLIMGVLQERWDGGVAGQFERAWRSETLADCATFGEWLVTLPEEVLMAEVIPAAAFLEVAQPEQQGTAEPALRALMDLGRQFEAQAKLDSALHTYRQAQALATVESGLAQELDLIIQDLADRMEEPAAPGLQLPGTEVAGGEHSRALVTPLKAVEETPVEEDAPVLPGSLPEEAEVETALLSTGEVDLEQLFEDEHAEVRQSKAKSNLSRRQVLYGALVLGGVSVVCTAVGVAAYLAQATGRSLSSQSTGMPNSSPSTQPAATRKTYTAQPTQTRQPIPAVQPTEASQPTATPRPTAVSLEPIPVRWFVGLGTGTQPEQVPTEEEWVELFNASQDEINLTIEVVANDVAFDTLKTQMAAGGPPDIVGPVGVRGSNEFVGVWLDLQDYLDMYDMRDFSQGAIDGWMMPGQGLIGLAIGVYPSALYVNYELFDKAGLDYPPQVYGDPYADGDEWTVEKMSELAMLLTVDANDNDATSAGFDPENIVQFGYHHQWTDPRGWATFFGAGSFVANDGTIAQCPDHWREAFNWYYNAEWQDYFAPNAPYQSSHLLAAGNPFGSGNVAMAHCHTWFTCCVPWADWNFATVPSYNGTITAKLHTDMVGVTSEGEYPDAAVRVVYEIANSTKLTDVWGALPAVQSLQPAFFATLDEQFTHGVNWDTILAGLDYVDVPNHESWMPNFAQADDRVKAFQAEMENNSNLDVDAVIDNLIEDLQRIF